MAALLRRMARLLRAPHEPPRLSARERAELVKQAAGYLRATPPATAVRVAESTLPGAGLGLFASRPLRRLEPLAFYPGTFMPPLPPLAFTMLDDATKGSTVATGADLEPRLGLNERDDAKNVYLLNLQEQGGFLDGKDAATEEPRFCAQLANHAPKGTRPNALALEFAWDELEAHLPDDAPLSASEVPNRIAKRPWFHDPQRGVVFPPADHPLAGMLLIAERAVDQDEEIFWDYGMRDGPERFPWYATVDWSKP